MHFKMHLAIREIEKTLQLDARSMMHQGIYIFGQSDTQILKVE